MRDTPAPTIPLKSSQRRRPLTLMTGPTTPRRSTESELTWSPRAYIGAFQQGLDTADMDSARTKRHRSMVSTASSASGELSDAQREHELSRRAYLENKMARRQQRLDALDRLQTPSRRSNSSSEEPDYAQQTMASLRKQLQTTTAWSNDGMAADDDSEERLSSDADSYEGRATGRPVVARAGRDNSSSILAWNEQVRRERAGQYRPQSSNYTYL